MSTVAAIFLAVLSIWDYPDRQYRHEQLRVRFMHAVQESNTSDMTELCRKGVDLFPDDPTWRYNLACALAYGKNHEPAYEALEKAIDLGFRDAKAIAEDNDLKRLAKETRFQELVEYAREMSGRPITYGPNACVPQYSTTGTSVALGEQNLSWDFENGLFIGNLQLAPGPGAYSGELYMNRDGEHSTLVTTNYPGLTVVKLDSEGHQRGLDMDVPNIVFPYPLFGNASLAYNEPKFWRSIPRMILTRDAWRLKGIQKLYLSNQLWVFPAHQDCPPAGKYGDVFSSICPYFLVTAGSSWTDLPYLKGALEASRSLKKETKAELVKRGLLAPTIMTLMRKSLNSVTNASDYLAVNAHPTALPAGALDLNKLRKSAAALQPSEIPPLASVSILAVPTKDIPAWPELTYASAYASAFVLRSDDEVRNFRFVANGAEEYTFSVLRGRTAAEIKQIGGNLAELVIHKSKMSVSNRVDVAVFGRNKGTGWGAPSYVSFAVVDPKSPYSDPVLTPTGPAATAVQKK